MTISVIKKVVSKGKNKFNVYWAKDKNGKYYDVKFTKNATKGALEESYKISVDDKDVFVTRENGFDKLVINGDYELVESIEYKQQPLPEFE